MSIAAVTTDDNYNDRVAMVAVVAAAVTFECGNIEVGRHTILVGGMGCPIEWSIIRVRVSGHYRAGRLSFARF